jgi:hypothetical protein
MWGPVLGPLNEDTWKVLLPALTSVSMTHVFAKDAIACKVGGEGLLEVQFVNHKRGDYTLERTQAQAVSLYRRTKGGVGPHKLVAKFFPADPKDKAAVRKADHAFKSERQAVLALRRWALVEGRSLNHVVDAAFVQLRRSTFKLGDKTVMSSGIVFMTPQKAPLNHLPGPMRTWSEVWPLFQQLVAALDDLRPTQFWDLKSANVMVSDSGDIKLIDLAGMRTPDDMQVRLRGSVAPPHDDDDDGRRKAPPVFITTTRTPGLTTDATELRWDLCMSKSRGQFWSIDTNLPSIQQLDECYMWVSTWCLIQIGLVLALQVTKDDVQSPLSSNYKGSSDVADVVVVLRDMLLPVADEPLVQAVSSLIDRAAKFDTTPPGKTFAEMML